MTVKKTEIVSILLDVIYVRFMYLIIFGSFYGIFKIMSIGLILDSINGIILMLFMFGYIISCSVFFTYGRKNVSYNG